jgi:ribose 5-phosphate isomerase B
MKVYFGADHRGYKLKEELQNWLKELKYAVKDMGAYEFNEKDDYSLYAEKVGSIVGKEKGSRGILLCGSGVGVDIVANKFDGVRASIGKSKEQIKAGRNDDDMNILVIAADYTSKEEAKGMLKVFLETKFSQKEKFKKRLEDIKRIEANN